MNKKQNVALVFGITSNYVFALANTLIGLVKHNNKFWNDIIIYYDSIKPEEMENINKITECTFVNFSDVKFLNKVSKELLDKYSEACFYRYECFNLLNKYKTVIWNDVDILIQGDISGLLEYGKESGFAATLNTLGLNIEANFNKLILDYNMFAPLYNSGILVLTDSLPNYEKMCDWCVTATKTYSEFLRWPDQGIINLMLQEFNIVVDQIDINKYCCHPSHDQYIKHAAIIHAYGDNKFWTDPSYQEKFPEWVENDTEWKERYVSSKSIEKKDTSNCPLVSCIMSTYNRYEYLGESVRSILDQTYINIELIVVLEKCENQSKIEKLLKGIKDKRIVVICNTERLGFAASLNVGIEAAQGKYIARMDDDDISLPTRFEKQVEYMESHPEVGICGTNAKFFGNETAVIGVETDPEVLKVITLYRTPFIHPTIMMRKDLIDKYNLRYDPSYFTEDYELWSRAIQYFPIANIDEILLNYRASNNNLTSGNNETKIHASHKKIMANQLNNYLKMVVTDNELETLQGRKNVLSNCYNYEETIKIKLHLCSKIIDANKTQKFYDEKILLEQLQGSQYETPPKQSCIKKVIKFIGRPLYRRLMDRVDNRITQHDQQIYNYINTELGKLNRKE